LLFNYSFSFFSSLCVSLSFRWTSLSDFSFNTPGPDCLVNYEGVRILSYFCIFIPFICNIVIIRHYVILAMKKKSIYVLTRECKSAFPLCFFVVGVSSSAHGILKLSYPDDQQPLAGRDLSVSLTLFFSETFTVFGLVTYLHVILQFLKGYSRMMTSDSKERVHERFEAFGIYSWFILPFTVIVGLLHFIAIAYPAQSQQLCMAHLIGMGAISIVYGTIAFSCLSLLLKELNMYIKNTSLTASQDIQLVVNRLSIAKMVTAFCPYSYGAFYIIFASSNLLFHLNVYFLLFAMTCISPATLIFVITISFVSRPADAKRIVPTTSSGEKMITQEVQVHPAPPV
jgi:hypothetical protein